MLLKEQTEVYIMKMLQRQIGQQVKQMELMQTIQQPGYTNKPISRATIVNAVTAVAHTADADSLDDWYSNGRTVLDLPRNQWETIALAA